MKINWYKSILAGLIGTLIFDISGFIITGQWWDLPHLLGAKLGVGLLGGVAGHYGNGVAIAIIYAALAPSLFGPNWFRGLSFTTVQLVMIVWLFMYPLLGLGIAGLEAGYTPAIASLVRHYLYMVPLILLLPVNTSKETSAFSAKRGASVATATTLLVAFSLILSDHSANAKVAEAQVHYRTVEVDGVEIFYLEAGTVGNPTVLLLHGFP
ncbi:MAG: hypothetical protein O7C75_17330, partial [Verrucomicrobia bacterium]|nr:hypothetical protein [Verrucomicrobiota bacterium]